MVTVRHFAELENNIVVAVIAIAENDCLDSDGNFQEVIGENICRRLRQSSLKWIECSTDGSIRKNAAALGMVYDEIKNGFYNPNKPFVSWILDETLNWTAPVAKPENVEGFYFDWDETSLSWVKIAETPVETP